MKCRARMKLRLRMKREGELKVEKSECYPGQEWVRGRLLGRGGFGSVHLADCSKMKALEFQGMPDVMAVKSTLVSCSEELALEKAMLERFEDCPFIVRCYGHDITYAGDEEFVLNIFLEFASGGTLSDLVSSYSGVGIPEPRVRRFTKSILKGLQRIHQEGFIHCDIKLDNVLLVKEDDSHDFVAKLADLGLVKTSEEPLLQGTTLYWAPEMSNVGIQGQPSDIWALGWLVLEMLTGTPPWDDCQSLTTPELLEVIATKSPTLPSGIFSDSAHDFLYNCFQRDPQRRPTAAMLLNHPFLAGPKEPQPFLDAHISVASPRPHNIFRPETFKP